MAVFFAVFGAIFLTCLGVRVVWVLQMIFRNRRSSVAAAREPAKPIKTLIILGSGGHTTEMITMTKHLNRTYYDPLEYCRASTDTTSVMRLKSDRNVVVHEIPRAREVGQSYVSSILTTLYAQIHAFFLIAKIRPGLILCNGPGTVLPLCVAALVWRIAGLCQGQIIFVESYCRVNTLSLTGKLLYPWADLFVVHWEELQQKYPNSKLVESFVPQRKDQWSGPIIKSFFAWSCCGWVKLLDRTDKLLCTLRSFIQATMHSNSSCFCSIRRSSLE